MIFAVSFLFVLVALYFLLYDSISFEVKRTTFEAVKITEKTNDINAETSSFLDFDLGTLIIPDEPSIIIINDKTV